MKKTNYFIIALVYILFFACNTQSEPETINAEPSIDSDGLNPYLKSGNSLKFLMFQRYYNNISEEEFVAGLSEALDIPALAIKSIWDNNTVSIKSMSDEVTDNETIPSFEDVADVCSSELYESITDLISVDPYSFGTLKEYVNAIENALCNSALDKSSEEYYMLESTMDYCLTFLVVREYIYDALNEDIAETKGWWSRWGRCAAGTIGGALTGGLTGALGGSAVPAVGTVIGGIVGGIGGGLLAAAEFCHTVESDIVLTDEVTIDENDDIIINLDDNYTVSVNDLISEYYENPCQ